MLTFEIKDNKFVFTYPLFNNVGTLNETILSEDNLISIDKIKQLLKETEYKIDDDVSYPLDEYDGYDGEIALKEKTQEDYEDELFEDMDNLVDNDSELKQNSTITNKTANPQRVDIILRNTFATKYVDYVMKTDIGNWVVNKVKNIDGKLSVTWQCKEEDTIFIDNVFFPNNSNAITIIVRKGLNEILYKNSIELYKIPVDYIYADKMFRKTYIPLIKKFIDSIVIRIYPFNTNFTFWRTDNPYFSYSFSSPKKNKIILALINFISTTTKPILDIFFEQNNLKHKQGYLQTLLDSSEAAGIFKFERIGNEILIKKGINYDIFLDGKLRRIQN
jgi:hypothetical protein